MKKMLAAVFKGNGVLTVEQVEIPQIKEPGQVLIKVCAASICGSDLHGLSVPPGQVMKPGIIYGHEFCGVIVQLGASAENFTLGDYVAVNPCVECGSCPQCKHSMGNLCRTPYHYGQTGDGGFAEYALVQTKQLYLLPPDTHPDVAAQTEPLACVVRAMETVRPMPWERVLLYGAGPIGLTFIKVLRIFGVRQLAVVAKGADRIAQAQKCGADFLIDSSGDMSVRQALAEQWNGRADVVIDAVGAGKVLEEAVHLLNARGRLLLFGLNHNALATVPPAFFTQLELQLMGVLGKSFPQAVALLQDRRLGLEELVTHRLPLSEITHAFDLLRRKEASRIIIYPDGNTPATALSNRHQEESEHE